MITYGKTFREFQDDGLNKVGTKIIFEDDSEWLIGNVNTLGGVCDDCSIHNEIIKGYIT